MISSARMMPPPSCYALLVLLPILVRDLCVYDDRRIGPLPSFPHADDPHTHTTTTKKTWWLSVKQSDHTLFTCYFF